MTPLSRVLRRLAMLSALLLLALPVGCFTRHLTVDGKVKVAPATVAVTALAANVLLMHPLVFRSLLADSNAILTDPHVLYPGFAFRLLVGMHYARGSKLANQDYLYSTAGIGLLGTALFYSLIFQPLPGGSGYQVSAADAGGAVPGSAQTISSLNPVNNLLEVEFAMVQVAAAAWVLRAFAMAWGGTSPVLIHEWPLASGDTFRGQVSGGLVGAAKGAAFTALLMSMACGLLPVTATPHETMRYRFASGFAALLTTMFLLEALPLDYRARTLAGLLVFETWLDLLFADPVLNAPAKAPGASKAFAGIAKAKALLIAAYDKIDAGLDPGKSWKLLAKVRDTLGKAEAAAPVE